MQLIRCLLSNFNLNMFRASLCPSSGEQDRVLLHMVFCTGCADCGCVELGRKLCALCGGYCSTESFLLMMGIMMSETCSDRNLIINIGLVASCWFISLHPKYNSTFCQRCKNILFLYINKVLCYRLKCCIYKVLFKITAELL